MENWRPNGVDFAYVVSLFENIDFTDPKSYIALAACEEQAAAALCGQPVIVATSSKCIKTNCSFLDKPFAAIDPIGGRLYISYTDFGLSDNGVIRLAACDIGTRFGTSGPLGGTNAAPVCNPGGVASSTSGTVKPFETIAGPNSCVQTGSYPAVDVTTGDVYVAYEFNWFSNLFFGYPCDSLATREMITRTPLLNLFTLTHPSAGPTVINSVRNISVEAAHISGYNRFPAQDFPRIAVSGIKGTVTIVWNDARFHPLADILMQSFGLGTLNPTTFRPVKLNSDITGGLHFLPMLRNDEANGNINVAWFQRASPSTDLTDIFAAVDLSPLITSTPANMRITSVSSSWRNVLTDISPDFGDYNDEYTVANPSFSQNTGYTTYYGWSDGRSGDAQPFEAHE